MDSCTVWLCYLPPRGQRASRKIDGWIVVLYHFAIYRYLVPASQYHLYVQLYYTALLSTAQEVPVSQYYLLSPQSFLHGLSARASCNTKLLLCNLEMNKNKDKLSIKQRQTNKLTLRRKFIQSQRQTDIETKKQIFFSFFRISKYSRL